MQVEEAHQEDSLRTADALDPDVDHRSEGTTSRVCGAPREQHLPAWAREGRGTGARSSDRASEERARDRAYPRPHLAPWAHEPGARGDPARCGCCGFLAGGPTRSRWTGSCARAAAAQHDVPPAPRDGGGGLRRAPGRRAPVRSRAAAFEVGSGYARQEPLQRIARRPLADLVDRVGQSAHLAILHGRDVLYVIEERAPDARPWSATSGSASPGAPDRQRPRGARPAPRPARCALYPGPAEFVDRHGRGPRTPSQLRAVLTDTRQRGTPSRTAR